MTPPTLRRFRISGRKTIYLDLAESIKTKGSNLAKIEVEEPNLPDVPMPEIPSLDDFDGEELGHEGQYGKRHSTQL